MTTPAPTQLTALHDDSWQSPWFGVALGTPKRPDETQAAYIARLEATDLTDWTIRAQARQKPLPDADEPLFEWTVDGGGIVLGRMQVTLSDGTVCEPPALQLRLTPADWDGKPTKWSGYLEVQLERGTSGGFPTERRTVIRKRRFKVVSDYTE